MDESPRVTCHSRQRGDRQRPRLRSSFPVSCRGLYTILPCIAVRCLLHDRTPLQPTLLNTVPAPGGECASMSCGETPRSRSLGVLLAHLPDYGLIICKSCKFAIQPKALSSHLLRHHIYRDKRQNILDRVAELTLLEPDQVSLPTTKLSAFPHLPVALGFRCQFQLCSHLCISQKRMSQHLRENHGCVNVTDVDGYAERAYLQTFFKGNKTRYFEVKAKDEKASSGSPQEPPQYRFVETSQRDGDGGLSPKPLNDSTPHAVDVAPATHLPMADLLYLHHYTTVTGLSLTRGAEPTNLWTHDLPLQALAQPFLMHAILGVGAFHQALLTSNAIERRRHQSAGLLHQTAGLATFRSMVGHPTQETSTAFTAFSRLLGVQSCVQALLESEDSASQAVTNLGTSRISKILEFFLLLRGGLQILLSMQDLLPAGSGLILSAEILEGLDDLESPPAALDDSAPYLANELCTRLVSSDVSSSPDEWPLRMKSLTGVRQLMNLCVAVSTSKNTDPITDSWITATVPDLTRTTDDIQHVTRTLAESHRSADLLYRQTRLDHPAAFCPPLLCYPHIPKATYAKLVSLPSRLMARVVTPTPAETRAFDQAMAALISSFSRSYAMDAVWARWNGIESWPRMLSRYFDDMIKATNPLALVLVAHWCVLLSMQEDHYFFLRGQSQRMLKIIMENLSVDMQEFVEDCVSSLL